MLIYLRQWRHGDERRVERSARDLRLSATIVFPSIPSPLYLVYIRSLSPDMTASFRNPPVGIKMQIDALGGSADNFFDL